MPILATIVSVVLAYLLGAIPTGLVVARVYKNVDITRVGSQRTGATNVLRTLGPGAAAIVFVCDLLKGALAVLLAGLLTGGDALAASTAATAAVVGHCYSVFIGFRGGRGVTPGLGALLTLAPMAALVAFALGGTLIGITRYVSLGSVIGAAGGGLALAVMAWVGTEPTAYALYGIVGSAFIIASHRDNIARIAAGTERRLGERVELR
ncbi:MAG: glycerol-3-phosphate 1-O-acyltransferase PlsY [Chloroflexota bacterium]